MDVEWRFNGERGGEEGGAEGSEEGRSGRKERVIPEGLARPNFRASKFQ